MKKTFSKEYTNAIKGVAVCLLLWHHLFYSGKNVIQTFFIKKYIIQFTALTSKVCVCIFLILSAYGLSLSYKKWKEKNKSDISFITDKYLSLISGFLFIFVLALISGIFFDRTPVNIYGTKNTFLYAFIDSLGFANLFKTPTFNATWWYMSLAAILIFVFPFIYKISQKFKYTVLLIFPFLIYTGICTNKSYNIQYFLAVFIGVLCSQLNLFEKIDKFYLLKNKHLNKLSKMLICITSISIIIYIRFINFGQLIIAYSILAFFIVWFCYEFLFYFKYIKIFFVFLGKHSANIFMTHTFLYSYYFHDFYFSFKNPVLIFIALLISSLLLSFVIDYLIHLTKYDKLVCRFREFIQKKTSFS